MKTKHIIVGAFLLFWLVAGFFAVRYLAGGFYLGIHKTDPTATTLDSWTQYWDAYKEDPKEKKKLQIAMGLANLLFFGGPLILFLASLNKSRSLHGDARWATHAEITKAGYFEDEGLILGKMGGKFLITNAPKFVMLVAPTRSGKGVGTIIPNLLNWSQSVIVVDIKGENFDVTSGFRAKHGHEVYRFSPFDDEFRSHRMNPLSYVSRDPKFLVGELQSVGYALYPKKDGDGAFWNDAARNLFVASSLYCIESGYPLTIGEILRRSSGRGRPKEFWQAVLDGGVSGSGQPLSQSCTDTLGQFVSNSDNTLTSILSTFNAPLGIFSNPAVDAATSGDDFDLRDIRRSKMSIYVVIPPNRLAEASLLVNLFFSTAIDQNTKTLPEKDPTLKYLALLLLDEFPALGRVQKYVQSIGYFAGYGMRSLMIAQSLSQLKDKDLYGDEGTKTLSTNHTIQIIYAPREQSDAIEYSEILGYESMSSTSKGTSRARGGATTSENVSDQKRALMLPQELRQMGPDRIVLVTDDTRPVFADKIKYYSDPVFKDRLLPPVSIPAIDLAVFMAKIEGKVRSVEPGEDVAVGALDLNMSTMPTVSKSAAPLAAETEAMANWLFSNVMWVNDTVTAPEANSFSSNESNEPEYA